MANQIHPTAIIGDNVILGEGNVIHPFTVILGPTTIGSKNIIGPNVVIGGPGQDTRNPRYDSANCPIFIGDENIIREFTAIQKPCYAQETRVGSRGHFMQSVHIPHDAFIDDDVVITPMCVLGGIVKVLGGANLGMGCSVHQYSIIGQYSIVATGAAVIKNVKPFSRYIPGKNISVNAYALKKFGFEEYTDEVSRYVLENIAPHSEPILAIVQRYEKLHQDSKREQY